MQADSALLLVCAELLDQGGDGLRLAALRQERESRREGCIPRIEPLQMVGPLEYGAHVADSSEPAQYRYFFGRGTHEVAVVTGDLAGLLERPGQMHQARDRAQQ